MRNFFYLAHDYLRDVGWFIFVTDGVHCVAHGPISSEQEVQSVVRVLWGFDVAGMK